MCTIASLWVSISQGVSDNAVEYTDAVFKLVTHEESDIWTSLSHSFTNCKGSRLSYYSSDMRVRNIQKGSASPPPPRPAKLDTWKCSCQNNVY